jgi:predicted ATPase
MYIKKIYYENVGPIEKINLDLPFQNNGNPKPIIFVGENGSGKSLLLSNIVDSFYEIAGQAFSNVTVRQEQGGHKYYKTMNFIQVKNNNNFLVSYIEYGNDQEKYEYIYKIGEKDFNIFKNEIGLNISDNLNWDANDSIKKINTNKKQSEDIFLNNIICSFSPNRYEKPVWMGDKYYNLSEDEHINIENHWSGELRTPIDVSASTVFTLKWLLDIIVDSRADINQSNNGDLHIVNVSTQNLLLLSNARKNIEKIMSEILGQDVFFSLNWRSSKGSRFSIMSKINNKIVVPTLDSLSTGQLALFNMFSTIIRYADTNDLNKSIHLADISGIVVIDEIELHLHSTLQRNITPKLIKLFPKIQFIITSHAPLFLLGMDEYFTKNGFEVYQMPQGTKIGVEMFSEFQRAYDYYTNTQKHHKEISDAITKSVGKPLVVTEGATDWKHIKTAMNNLKEQEEYRSLFENLDFDFLEYEPKNSSTQHQLKLDMGWSPLVDMCESFAKIRQLHPIIFICDNDETRAIAKLGMEPSAPQRYKIWGNNVFSLTLPIPASRNTTPEICIEHYYSDAEIKKEIVCADSVSRRLYMGNEFDNDGIAENINRFCKNRNSCGPNKINIIDGSEKERVRGLIENKETNFALSKMEFAEKILGQVPPFNTFNFENFLPLFKIIKSILHHGNEGQAL